MAALVAITLFFILRSGNSESRPEDLTVKKSFAAPTLEVKPLADKAPAPAIDIKPPPTEKKLDPPKEEDPPKKFTAPPVPEGIAKAEVPPEPAGLIKTAALPALAKAKGPLIRADVMPAIHPGVDQAKVDRAIDSGVAFLRKHAKEEILIGSKALAGLALLHSGVGAADPVVQFLAKDVRENATRRFMPYDISACIWFLDRLGQEKDKPLIRSLGLRLIANQQDNGGWGYFSIPLAPAQEKTLLTLLGGNPALELLGGKMAAPPLLMEFGGRLPVDFRDLPAVRYKPGKGLPRGDGALNPNRADNSLTQFAVIGLWVSKRHGVPAGRSLLLAEERFRASQAPDGAWSYEDNLIARPGGLTVAKGPGLANLRDTATCAGLLALAAGAASRMEAEALGEKAFSAPVDKALQFLGRRLETYVHLPPLVRKKRATQTGVLYQHFLTFMKVMDAPGPLKPKEDLLDLASRLLKTTDGAPGLLPALGGMDFKTAWIGADAWGDLYYLWSLERMAMAYDLKTIGKRDWYVWGVPLLLANQEPDGSWREAYPGVPDTCFALLFLKRANLLVDLTVSLEGFSLPKGAGERRGQWAIPLSQPVGPGIRADQPVVPGLAVGQGDRGSIP